jgi:hypothetical protein
MTEAAKNFSQDYKKKSVVICDRGLLDGKAYAGQ